MAVIRKRQVQTMLIRGLYLIRYDLYATDSLDTIYTHLSMFFILPGPSCWGSCYETCKSGQNQSPIDVYDGDREEVSFTPLVLQGYDVVRDMTLYNDGHSGKSSKS